MDQWLVDIVEEIQASNDLSGIKCVLVKIRAYLGFSNISYAVKYPETFTRSSTIFVGNYPSEWTEHYRKQGYINIDPVAEHCCSSQILCQWRLFQ